jgi:hypothetical protein
VEAQVADGPLEFSWSTNAPAPDCLQRPNGWTTYLFTSELLPTKGLIREVVSLRSQILS